MTTFALVHGAWHSAAVWDPTAALLRAAGHRAVAVDLPCEDAGATLADGAAAVLRAVDDVDEDDLVVVGHSLGGLTIPLVAADRRVRELVFVCAFVPVPGVSLRADLEADGTFAPGWGALAVQQERHDGGTTSWPAGAAIDAFYHDCPPDLARWATTKLRRQSWAVAREPSPLTAYPDVPSRAIVCSEDRVLDPEGCARVATERLGAPVVRLGGGHSPMLAQPEALAGALLAPVHP